MYPPDTPDSPDAPGAGPPAGSARNAPVPLGGAAEPGAAAAHLRPDDPTWQEVAQIPEFIELVEKKRRWVVPATAFFLFWYLLFIFTAGYAEDFMGSEFLVDGLTVGYVFALSQFVMTFGLAIAYVRRSRDVFDPLRVRALERAAEVVAARTTGAAGTTGTTGSGPARPAGPGGPTDGPSAPRDGGVR